MKPRDLLNQRPTNDSQRANMRQAHQAAHNAALAAEMKAQARAKDKTL